MNKLPWDLWHNHRRIAWRNIEAPDPSGHLQKAAASILIKNEIAKSDQESVLKQQKTTEPREKEREKARK